MRLIAVVGSGSGCGKTTLVCHLLEAFPGFGAVKISPREGEPRVEWGPGAARKDTARYSASGAVKVARIVGPRAAVGETWSKMEPEFSGCAGVIVEGAGSLLLGADTVAILVYGGEGAEERPERTAGLEDDADIVVVTHMEKERESPSLGVAFSHPRPGKPVLHVSLAPHVGDMDEWARVVSAVRDLVGQLSE